MLCIHICDWLLFILELNVDAAMTDVLTGTMSGGGKSVCKGRMGTALVAEIDPKQLANMENMLEKVFIKIIGLDHPDVVRFV